MRCRGVGLRALGVLCALVISAGAGGCQPEGNSSPPTGPAGATGAGEGWTTWAGGSGAGGRSAGGAGDGPGAGAATAESGGGGAAGDRPAARVATIEEITTGVVASGTRVALEGVVAMSQKFFLDDTRSGECLWGVFLSSPGLEETAPHSGILAISRSEALTDAEGKLVCPRLDSASAGDPFPDDVAPGDVLDVIGETAYFSSSSCRDTCGDLRCEPPEDAGSCRQDCGATPELIPQSAVGQYQIERISRVTRTGRVVPPAPHVLTTAEALKLSSPDEADFHHAWGGVKVRLQGAFAPVLRTGSTGEPSVAVSYGNIHLYLQDLPGGYVQVGNKLYYIGGSQDACHRGPVYSDVNTVFTRVDGFVYNSFCIWSLQPTNKCTDIDPPSEDCTDDLRCP